MILTLDIPESTYKHLARIAAEELGDGGQASVEILLRENLNDVFARTARQRFGSEKALSPSEALAMVAKYGGTNPPEEHDRLE